MKGKRVLSDKEWYSKNSRKMMSTGKRIIWILTINAVLWVWCSYILAWFDKGQIAEQLSSNVCTVIIGQTLGYLVTSCITGIFRYNPKFGGDSTYPDDIRNREEHAANNPDCSVDNTEYVDVADETV